MTTTRRLVIITDNESLPTLISQAVEGVWRGEDHAAAVAEIVLPYETLLWSDSCEKLSTIFATSAELGRWLCVIALSAGIGEDGDDEVRRWYQCIKVIRDNGSDVRTIFCGVSDDCNTVIRFDREQHRYLPKDRWWKRIIANGERAARDSAVAGVILEAIRGTEDHGWLRFAFPVGDEGAFDPEDLDMRRQLFHCASSGKHATLACESIERYAEVKRLAGRLFYLCRGGEPKAEEVVLEALPKQWIQSMFATLEDKLDVPIICLQGVSEARICSLEYSDTGDERPTFFAFVSKGKFCTRIGAAQREFLGLIVLGTDDRGCKLLGDECQDVVAVRANSSRNDNIDLVALSLAEDQHLTLDAQRIVRTHCAANNGAALAVGRTLRNLGLTCKTIDVGTLRSAEIFEKRIVITYEFFQRNKGVIDSLVRVTSRDKELARRKRLPAHAFFEWITVAAYLRGSKLVKMEEIYEIATLIEDAMGTVPSRDESMGTIDPAHVKATTKANELRNGVIGGGSAISKFLMGNGLGPYFDYEKGTYTLGIEPSEIVVSCRQNIDVDNLVAGGTREQGRAIVALTKAVGRGVCK